MAVGSLFLEHGGGLRLATGARDFRDEAHHGVHDHDDDRLMTQGARQRHHAVLSVDGERENEEVISVGYERLRRFLDHFNGNRFRFDWVTQITYTLYISNDYFPVLPSVWLTPFNYLKTIFKIGS